MERDYKMIIRRWSLMYAFLISLAVTITAAGPVSAKTSQKEEIEIGKKAALEIEKEFPLTDNKQWTAEINKLGNSLTPYVKRKGIPYTFKIIKERVDGENQIDAFSLPGGPVYFSERLWQLLTRDERMGVLAHEISHVDKRHAIDTMSEAQRRSMWAAAILIISGAGNGVWNATDLANQLYTLKYSRKRETEADMTAVDLCRMAGSNPAGIVTAMNKLLRIEDETGGSSIKILSTHPQTKDRVNYLSKRCMELGMKPEDFEVKFRDRPDRVGDVVSRAKDEKTLTISTVRPLTFGESVWVMKPLWSETANAVVPTLVAKGKALVTGNRVQISCDMEQGFEYIDIEPGDGIYPAPPIKAPSPPVTQTTTTSTPADAKTTTATTTTTETKTDTKTN